MLITSWYQNNNFYNFQNEIEDTTLDKNPSAMPEEEEAEASTLIHTFMSLWNMYVCVEHTIYSTSN